MQIDIRVPVGRPLPEVAGFIGRCEDAGLDGVGVHDHPHSGRDAYVALALAAQQTRRLRLFPATSSPQVRHPLLLAALAQSLNEIAPGRITLTVAPGFLSVRSIGQQPASVASMRQAIIAMKRLLAGETVTLGSTAAKLRNASQPAPPVYLLAAGPRMLELAGEVADGALLFVGVHPEAIRAARRSLQAGAERAGRSLAGFRTVFIITLALDDSLAAAREWTRRRFAPGQPWLCYPSASNLFWLRQAGLDLPQGFRPEALDEEQVARIVGMFGLFGPPELCAERLLQIREESQVDHVFLFPAHDLETGYRLPEREVEAIERVLRPRVG
jgi:5,10-methylenetetrahydromethanopterin reductase